MDNSKNKNKLFDKKLTIMLIVCLCLVSFNFVLAEDYYNQPDIDNLEDKISEKDVEYPVLQIF